MKNASWIKSCYDMGEACPIFKKEFIVGEDILSANLSITSMGVYEANLNGQRVGNFILAPGFTSYKTRLQYQTYDVKDLLKGENQLCVTVGNGWYCGKLAWMNQRNFWGKDCALIAELVMVYPDRTEIIETDSTWLVAKSHILRAEIYDGEIYDARIIPDFNASAMVFEHDKSNIIPQEGEIVTEHERLKPIKIFTAPNGETVVDFGQNITGYVEFTITANEGDKVEFSHGEILDKEGNFFRENLRTAMQKTEYFCKAGKQTYKPRHTFMGFRYIRVEKAPKEIEFTAIVVHSDIKRIGKFECGNEKINKLFNNIIWGQKGNFLDIPTDCPQRDERLGWTGDAQVFIRTASYNYDVERFFGKWLNDLKADQLENGSVPHVIPNILEDNDGSAAWGDAAVICPWQIYLTYGNKDILRRQFESMKKWVEFSRNPNRMHFGDWLAQDKHEYDKQEIIIPRPEDKLKGHSSQKFISDAYNLYTTQILIKVGELLKEDMSEYKQTYKERLAKFQETYQYHTQTECALSLYFNIAKDKKAIADKLAELVRNNGNRLSTGFVGTPYLLHALSQNGHIDVAYDLLLQEAYPSWIFSVNRGATTIWEHWDGVREDGSFNDCGMNSYNHYAYGAVADWMYGVVVGINIDENEVAFENVILKPMPSKKLGYAYASIETKYGMLSSLWSIENDVVNYEFLVPNKAQIVIGNEIHSVNKGQYKFSTKL